VQYPSGRTVTTCYNTNGRVKWVDQTLTPSACQHGDNASTRAYANISAYWPQGAPQTSFLGNGLTEGTTYNNRLQMTGLTAGSWLTLGYFYCPSGEVSCTSNNGNLWRQTIAAPESTGELTLHLQQDYVHDAANRLTSVQETVTSGLPSGVGAGNWSTTHSYDGFGNMWANSTLALSPAPPSAQSEYDAVTNRLVKRPNGAALPADAYDAAGNLRDHPDMGQMTYDAQNRVVAYSYNGGGAVRFVYDGEGHRVQKSTAAGTTTYVYDGFGQLAAEYGTSADAGTQYLTADHLGSTRLVTDANGAVVQRLDYQPFGGTLIGSQTEGNRNLVTGYAAVTGLTVKYTGKERDSETGLDYFESRYYSAAQGRFTSPDEFKGGIVDPFTGQDIETNTALPYADITDPQTLNKYAYVRNNPLRYVDPDGHDWTDPLDFVAGAFRGAAASISWGTVGAPTSSDSLASRAGQIVGTVVVGVIGADAAIGGGTAAFVTAPAAATGIGALVPAAAAGVAVAGVAATAGAVKNIAAMSLVKPASGQGTVPPDQRDPKRTLTDSEKGKKLAEQGGKCAHCEQPINGEKGIAHHDPVRHADWGKEMKIVHKACHDALHACLSVISGRNHDRRY
jgi:RHS repeat-associated protein